MSNSKNCFRKATKPTSANCCVNTSSVTWMGAKELETSFDKLCGPEVALFYRQLQESDAEKIELMKD